MYGGQGNAASGRPCLSPTALTGRGIYFKFRVCKGLYVVSLHLKKIFFNFFGNCCFELGWRKMIPDPQI